MPKSRSLTQRQLQGAKSLRDTINLDTLTIDELKLILFFLYQWEIATNYANHAHLIRNPKVKGAPPNEYNSANFSRLRYKLEHAVYPKQID